MSDITKRAERRADDASHVEDKARNGDDDVHEERSDGGRTITGELKETFREAAIEVLKPVMRKATTSAAKYAVTRGPRLVKDTLAPKVADAGGAGAIVKGVASKGGGVAGTVGGVASAIGSKLPGGDKGKSPSGTGRGRRLPVQEYVDVGVDLETAYDQFTQFEDWPRFMHRVERIEQRDDTTLMWHENIWGVRRSWEAEITEQIPCERLVWRSKNGPQTIGVVTFHRLSDQLTRVAITMDFQPQGLFEKTSSGTRISRRALISDLMRFKAFVELRDDATGSWRGRIEDGEVVDADEETQASMEDEEPEAGEEEDEELEADEDEDEEPEAIEDEEPEAREDEDEYEDEDDDDEEESRGRDNGRFTRERDKASDEESVKVAPRPRRRRKPAAASSSRSKR